MLQTGYVSANINNKKHKNIMISMNLQLGADTIYDF